MNHKSKKKSKTDTADVGPVERLPVWAMKIPRQTERCSTTVNISGTGWIVDLRRHMAKVLDSGISTAYIEVSGSRRKGKVAEIPLTFYFK